MASFVSSRLRLVASTCLAAGLASPALAQLAPPAPVRQAIDGNGVDLFLGTINLKTPSLTIGQGDPQGLDYHQLWRGSGWSDNLTATLNLAGSTMTVSLGGISDRFTVSGSTYTATEANGATLTLASNIYTYTRADGTIVTFNKNFLTNAPYYSNAGRVTQVVRPSGAKLTYGYTTQQYCYNFKPGGGGYICMQTGTLYRINTVRNSYGYQLTFDYSGYEYMYDPTAPENQPDFAAWSEVVGGTATNLAIASGASTPSLAFSDAVPGFHDVTDPMARVTRYRMAGGTVAGIKLPGSVNEDMVLGYGGGRVTSVMTLSGITAYAASDAAGVRTVTVTDPLTHVTTYKFNIASQRLTEVTDALTRTTAMQYDASGRLTRTTAPEGNYVQLTYDARGNVTEQRGVAKAGSGLADIVTTASFPATCTNPKTCNQATWTRDAKANQTDYTYDAAHGGVLTVTAPAPSVGAVRPQTRLSYTSLQAYFKVSGGSIVASGEPVTKLTGSSACQTGATCNATADEVKTTVGYGPQVAGTGNNLLPISIAQGAGDNSLTAATANTYDDVGNLTYVDGPLPGTADTARALYNADRELIGAISPDPDGAGGLKNRAQRITIDAKGLVAKQENGTTNGQTDPAWAAFAPAEAIDITYDTSRRPVTRQLSAGGTAYALTQTSYDLAGRVDCAASRMNPAIYGALPASACTLGTVGSFGPDRIAKTIYDNANQVTQKQIAVGTADVATETTLTYSNNGKLLTLTDAEVNKTTYEYDGFDRLSKTRMPLPTQGANASSATDYEQLTYDAASNLTSRRLRDAQSIALTYDNLNRVTLKNLPGTEPDVSYAYDNLGRLTSASQTGNALTFTYDALSRNLTQAGPQGTVSSQWDLAGRRTRLTYPGAGLYIDQDYLVTGETTKLRENGATSGIGVLATLAYDDLGRRASLTRGNGTVTTYGFDLVSRLASLAENLTGTTNDQTATFAYNPASQIASMSKTNDIYAWTGTGSGTTASVANGLNQLTSIAGAATAHDSKGNLTSDPTAGKSYTYSSENLLKTSSGGTAASLTYDPSMRLAEITGAATTKFQYDGLALIAEYDAVGALTKRYVHGPGVDEPLIEYDGSGTTTKRWLHADERGSIIAISDAAGNVTTINRYDEYGKPQGTNLGRFQYTGQTWLPELGAYYYKARIYVPQLGRFLQTDPIGFAGGINWYAYAGNDPLNSIDALGLQDGPVIVVTGRRGPKRSGGLGGNGLAAFQAASAPTPIQLMPPRQTKEITACEANFAGAAIDKTGKSYSIPEVEFRSGLDNQANWLTEQAYSKPGVRAVTQGDVVYVNPKHWSDVTNPEKTTFWEEIVHSSQFVTIGYYKFYVAYGEASLTAVLRGGDDYFDNSLEKEAQELARELSQSYRKSKPCVR